MMNPLANQELLAFDLLDREYLVTDYAVNTVQTLPTWLSVAFFLTFSGLLGMMYNYRNFLVTMMCVEVMYLGVVTSFVLYGIAFSDPDAAVYALLILIFAASESAIGLGLLIVLYRFNRAIDFEAYTTLGGPGASTSQLFETSTISSKRGVPCPS